MLALDVGTSSVRAGLYDSSGTVLAGLPAERAAYGWTATPDGGMETDAERLFELAAGVVNAAVEGARETGVEIAAVAVSAFWHSLVGVDADGKAVTRVYGWGEMRSVPAALRLRERVDPGAAHARTGCFVHPSYPAAKLLWLREATGATLPRVAAWMSFGEYLELRLFGVRRCSLSMASGTGLLDLRALRWDPELLDAVGVEAEALSPLADTDAPTPPLLREWLRRWPELAGVPWIPPLGDGACANVGSGAVGPGRVGVSIGTSAAVRSL
ncbi:MAG TPA: FGGY family carbohydrate kinase, partial [Longimicrobiaceae bacterium]|nr:FGGY family carbohydrate kinase [Longimicrobiaceae bacterium]